MQSVALVAFISSRSTRLHIILYRTRTDRRRRTVNQINGPRAYQHLSTALIFFSFTVHKLNSFRGESKKKEKNFTTSASLRDASKYIIIILQSRTVRWWFFPPKSRMIYRE